MQGQQVIHPNEQHNVHGILYKSVKNNGGLLSSGVSGSVAWWWEGLRISPYPT